MNVVGNDIKKNRELRKMSYEELSAKLELMGISIHKQSIYDIEVGKRTVKDYELFGIALILNMNIQEILELFEKEI